MPRDGMRMSPAPGRDRSAESFFQPFAVQQNWIRSAARSSSAGLRLPLPAWPDSETDCDHCRWRFGPIGAIAQQPRCEDAGDGACLVASDEQARNATTTRTAHQLALIAIVLSFAPHQWPRSEPAATVRPPAAHHDPRRWCRAALAVRPHRFLPSVAVQVEATMTTRRSIASWTPCTIDAFPI
jgi:hypothetical protein